MVQDTLFTRNTKLYTAKYNDEIVVYKTLTLLQLKIIDNVNNQLSKAEIAFDLAYVSGPIPDFLIKEQIGKDAIEISSLVMSNPQLLELTVEDVRVSIKSDLIFDMMITILNIIPNTTIEYLFNLTFNDLIELTVLAENQTNKKLFKFDNKVKQEETQIGDPSFFNEDAGNSMQDKMKELGDF